MRIFIILNWSIRPSAKLKVPALLCRYVSLYSPPASLEPPQYHLLELRGRQRTQRIINFSLPLRGRKWKSTKQITLRKRQKASNLWLRGANTGILLPEGLSPFVFRRPCPVECEAYSSGVSEKQKRKTKTLRSLRLCGEQFFIEAPLRGDYWFHDGTARLYRSILIPT